MVLYLFKELASSWPMCLKFFSSVMVVQHFGSHLLLNDSLFNEFLYDTEKPNLNNNKQIVTPNFMSGLQVILGIIILVLIL